MGSWGVALFSDDLACDVRDEYQAALTDGLTGDGARDRVLFRFAAALADTEAAPLVWLALAATAWKLGRLDDITRDLALGIIVRREGLERWDEAGLGTRREAELQKLADTLRGPQKPPVAAKKKRGFVSAWVVGEIVGYRQDGGKWLALHVVAHTQGEVGAFPVVNLLDWTSETAPPTEADLAAAMPILFPPEWDLSLPKGPHLCLMLTRKLERSDSFARWGLHRPSGRTQPFEDTDLSYVGLALFERDIVGKWRSGT
ncbi:MAG: hypothetical protein MUE83_13225 [Tabrizicola sp.]|jgi:hypothetical protein|nr:hypothetical protein [Tabrizicola sp.]